jgi:hypothetical protein
MEEAEQPLFLLTACSIQNLKEKCGNDIDLSSDFMNESSKARDYRREIYRADGILCCARGLSHFELDKFSISKRVREYNS